MMHSYIRSSETNYSAAFNFPSNHRPRATLGASTILQKTSETQKITGSTANTVPSHASVKPASVSRPPERRYM